MKCIICLGFLILITEGLLAQELDDKIPLLDEPMIIQEVEKLDDEEPPIQESEEGTITPSLEASTTQPLTETTTLNTTQTTTSGKIPITPPKASEEGITTPPLGTTTEIDVSVGSSTIGTTTLEFGSPTSKNAQKIKLLNTGLILIPTAYRRDNKRGFNTDFIIAYYIGELWYKYEYGVGKKDSGFFEPIKFLFVSTDFKFSLLKEKERIPHFGMGYEWFLVLQGEAPSPAQMGGKFSGKSERFGFPYFILSKEFKNTRYHLGMMSGEIGKLLNPLSKYMKVDGKKAVIFGIDTTLFARKINIEGICPLDSEFHLIVNTSIERFIGFELGFMKMPDGISIVGYFGIRLTIFPYIKD